MSVPCEYHLCYNIYRPGCTSSFFKLPTNENRRNVWKKHCGRPDMNESARICDNHFFENDFIIQNLKKTLVSTALPRCYSKTICSCDEFQMDKSCVAVLLQEVDNKTSNVEGNAKQNAVIDRLLVDIPSKHSKNTIKNKNRDSRRNTVRALIDSNNAAIRLVNVPSNQSQVQNSRFKVVFVNGIQQDMAICTECSKLEFIEDGLENHRCTALKIASVSSLATTTPNNTQMSMVTTSSGTLAHSEEMAPLSEEKLDNQDGPAAVNENYQRDMMKEQLAFSYAELFPLEGFNDMGFKMITKYLLDVGAKYGKINVDDLLVDKKTLEDERSCLEYMLKDHIKKVIAQEKVVFSCDMWKHPYHLKICITLSGHYIDENFVIHRNILGTRIYDENEFDGEKLVEYVNDILKEYTNNFSSILSNATIVTSKTECFSKAFQNYDRLNCMCTTLNDVINHLLALPYFQTENVCKAIIMRLERQPANETYKFVVSNFQLDNWHSIWELFEAYRLYLKIGQHSKNIIQYYDLIELFLTEFHKISKLLSSSNEASISTIYLVKLRLIDIIRTYNEGSFKFPEFKNTITMYAEQSFEITDIHRITLFLDPRYKSLKFLSTAERELLYSTVRGIIGEIFPPDQNLKTLKNFGDHVSYVDANGEAEVDEYLNLWYILPDTNILQFWRNRMDFPKLRNLAKEILSIPAASAAWECYFNKEQFNLSRRRLYLDLNEIDTTLLLNGHKCYELFDKRLTVLINS